MKIDGKTIYLDQGEKILVDTPNGSVTVAVVGIEDEVYLSVTRAHGRVRLAWSPWTNPVHIDGRRKEKQGGRDET